MPLRWIMLVSKRLYKRAIIITKYQIAFLRKKFFEFILAIAKETYFSIFGGEDFTLLVWNLRVQLVFRQFKSQTRSLRSHCVSRWVSDEE